MGKLVQKRKLGAKKKPVKKTVRTVKAKPKKQKKSGKRQSPAKRAVKKSQKKPAKKRATSSQAPPLDTYRLARILDGAARLSGKMSASQRAAVENALYENYEHEKNREQYHKNLMDEEGFLIQNKGSPSYVDGWGFLNRLAERR